MTIRTLVDIVLVVLRLKGRGTWDAFGSWFGHVTFWSRADLTLIFSHPRDWFRFLELLSWTQMTTGSCGGHTATRDELPLVWSWKGRSRRGSLVAKGLLSWREGGSRGEPGLNSSLLDGHSLTHIDTLSLNPPDCSRRIRPDRPATDCTLCFSDPS